MKVPNPHEGVYYGNNNDPFVKCMLCGSEDIHAMNCELEVTSSNIPEGQVGGEKLGYNYCLCRVCYFAFIHEVQEAVSRVITPRLEKLMSVIRYWKEKG